MTENRPEDESVASKSMELNAQWNILRIENGEPIEIRLAGSQSVTLKLACYWPKTTFWSKSTIQQNIIYRGHWEFGKTL